MMRLAWFGIFLTGALCGPAHASTRIDFNQGWQFRIDQDGIGEASGWTRSTPAETRSVNLPHTWNLGEYHDYLGVGWYFRQFAMPPLSHGAHVELHFGATFYKARVWLNGVELGAHEGGFTAYSYDISGKLRDNNTLVVQIDNRPGTFSIPGFGARGTPDAWYDWWAFGGIVRDVWLTTSSSAWINRQRIRSELNTDRAIVRDQIFFGAQTQPAAIRITLYDPFNNEVVRATQPLKDSAAGDATVSLTVLKPKLWSIDRPNVYRMQAELLDGAGKVVDEHSDTFGLRTVGIRDRHLLVNGERVRLTGLTRHEDSPWEGLAETRGTMRQDFDDMKALHTTLTRPVHYPQNAYILDYADRHGILLVPEIPVWQFSEEQLANPAVLALAQRQMQEMIEQAGNHPSIFAWSVANESATGTPGGVGYFHAMRAFIRKLDPERFVTYADDNLAKLERAEQSAANEADFLLMNQYYGTWHGPSSALNAALDRVNNLFPTKMVIISEFGYPGVFAKNPAEADQLRIKTIQEQMPMMAARDWIAGTILWCYQDYKSRRNLWPGQTEGYVEHGLVDEWRQRKPSYEAWKTLSAPAKIEAKWLGQPGSISGFTAMVTPNSVQNIPYYPLHDYQLVWNLYDEKGKLILSGKRSYADLNKADQLSETFAPDTAARSPHLIVTLSGPTEEIAAQRSLEWPK